MARVASSPFRPNRPSTGRGRGARSNRTGRFEQEVREETDDGWTKDIAPDPRTDIHMEKARRIITFNDSPYVGFDRSINMYRGCEHGCIYCFARPTHSYLGLSAGIDFETQIFAKPDAARLLEKELSSKRYQVRPIAIGTNTDPYQPVDRRFQLMREVLKVLAKFNHPVSILTKSDLILRDIDILAPMAAKGLARAMLSVTTLDPKLARAMEPRVPRPDKRLGAIKALAEAGIPTGVMHGPLIPGLSDHELEALMEEGRKHGATFAAYTLLRLPQEVAPLFKEWLEAYAPGYAKKVINHLTAMNNGKIYDAHWSREAGPKGEYAHLFRMRFASTWKRLGFRDLPPLRTDLFHVPKPPDRQRDLFA